MYGDRHDARRLPSSLADDARPVGDHQPHRTPPHRTPSDLDHLLTTHCVADKGQLTKVSRSKAATQLTAGQEPQWMVVTICCTQQQLLR